MKEFAATPVDGSFVDVVHDNHEVYAIARHKQPLGKTGAKTDSNWYLKKGEPMHVVSYNTLTRQLRVRCPLLRGAMAWIPEERVMVDLGGEHGKVAVWGPPVAYDDITTCYSGQVSIPCHIRRAQER